MKHKPHTQVSPVLSRVAETLRAVVHELSRAHRVPLTSRVMVRLARGIALSAQAARITPAQFDSTNGRDALAALAHAISQPELHKLADSNVLMLSAQWSKVVYVAGLELSKPALPIAEIRDAADIQSDPPRNPYANPKLFDKWMPK